MAEQISNTKAAFSNFRPQQRRPSNLLQCMDKDGNIDAFRYIEYSRQRRMAFLKRADFICKMKSTLRLQQQQQQQQLNRSASLPGMTGVVPGVVSSQANATFSNVVTPEMLHKSLGRRNSMGTMGVATKVPGPLCFMPRSASMPFVPSFASNNQNVVRSADQQKNSSLEANTAAPPAPLARQRSLRKEEFEAAEALLFGMSRGSKSEKRTSDDSGKTTEAAPTCKKQKLDDARTEEMASVLSVVSTEEETNNSSGSITSNALHEDEGIDRVKSTESSE